MIYLDNAATTKIDNRVLEAMMPYLTNAYGNAGTLYKLGRDSADAVAKARMQVADLIGAKPDQIIFTSGGSEANNLVFAGSKDYLITNKKTHIVTTRIEHDSILNAVRNLCQTHNVAGDPGFDAAYVPPMNNSSVSDDTVIDYINESDCTGIVAVMHTNNETGLENKGLQRIGEFCRENGILFHTDCVQAAGCSKLCVDDMKCDFLSISSHKIHGPKGVGALYVRDKSVLSPLICGGKTQEFGLRGGTENVAGIVGFGEACEILRLEQKSDSDFVSLLRKRLYHDIKKNLARYKLDDICHINGDLDLNKCGKTISMRFDNVDSETLLLMLDSKGICVSAGSACRSHESEPSHVLLAMGISPEDARNSIRFSLSKMNTERDVEIAAQIIADCVHMLSFCIDFNQKK